MTLIEIRPHRWGWKAFESHGVMRDNLFRVEREPEMHFYEIRPRTDKRGVDLISDALPFGRLWYAEQNAISNAIGYAEHHSRSHHAVIRVYDDAGNVIETREHKGDFKEW